MPPSQGLKEVMLVGKEIYSHTIPSGNGGDPSSNLGRGMLLFLTKDNFINS